MTKKGKKSTIISKRSKRERKPGQVKWIMFVVVIIGSVMIGSWILLRAGNKPPSQVVIDDASMSEARTLYENNCASCHGVQGEGHIQLNAPALDSSEHAWHHPDEQIIGIIRNGGFQMPPVGAGMTDEQIETIIAYFKQWWTPQQQEFQQGEIGE